MIRTSARASPAWVAILTSSLFASGLAATPGQVDGADATASPVCTHLRQSERVIELDCQPGFATLHDSVVVYLKDPEGGDEAIRDFSDSVWLFDAGATGRTSLLIDFSGAAGKAVADLYDDRDGDGAVQHLLVGGVPRSIESRYPTVTVVSRDGWWVREGRTSFNLDLSVDGPVRATFGSDLGQTARLYDRLAHDGVRDYAIHVRDTGDTGAPDVEWRQFYPPLSERPSLSGHYRTEIVRNPDRDEVPIDGSALWPYLGPQAGSYVKGYGESKPPIMVDWKRSQIVQVAEFVASRGNPGSFFVYSINRVKEGSVNATNFENPFAFYDLADANDGRPDMTIRFVRTLPNEAPTIATPVPINVVAYTWDQFHRHNWTYALNLVGSQPIDHVIRFPDFTVKAVPPEELPDWVAAQEWSAATFVEVTDPTYWTSERVYHYSMERGGNLVPFSYLTGLTAPPDDIFEQIEPRFRGEYSLRMNGPARLYVSPVDRRLHLHGATAGVWNLGNGRELRYGSLGSPLIRHWMLNGPGGGVAELYLAADQLIYVSPDVVWIGRLEVEAPALITAPRDHEEWVAMGEMVRDQDADFEPHDLHGMFWHSATEAYALPRASVTDVRLTDAGFRLLIDLPVIPSRVPWLAGREPGSYVAEYSAESGYSVRPVAPAALEISAPEPVGATMQAGAQSALSVKLSNSGDRDLRGIRVTAFAARRDDAAEPIGTSVVDVPARGTREVRIAWAPPEGGEWLVEARSERPPATGPQSALSVREKPDGGAAGVLEVQGLPFATPLFAALVLASGSLLAGRLGTRIRWPPGVDRRRVRMR